MYRYKVISLDGEEKIIKSYKEKNLFIEELERNGYIILESKKIRSNPLNRRLSSKEIYLLAANLSIMLDSGINILDSIEILSKNKKTYIKESLEELFTSLQNGISLSTSLKRQNNLYPGFLINMIYAGEHSGNLSTILDKLSGFYKSKWELKSKIKNILIYPSILLSFSILVLALLVNFILPQFQSLYSYNDFKLPKSTIFLLNTSNFLKRNWIFLGIFLFSSLIIYNLSTKRKNLSLFNSKILVSIPFIGKIVIYYNLIVISDSLSILLDSGIPIFEAFDITRELIENSYISNGLNRVLLNLEKGKAISKTLEDFPYIPDIFKELISVGENSGELSKMLKKLNSIYVKELEEYLDRLVKYIEPGILFILSILIGFVVISMTLPILNLIELMDIN